MMHPEGISYPLPALPMNKGKVDAPLPFLLRIPSPLFSGIRDIPYAGSKRIRSMAFRRNASVNSIP